MKDQNWKNLLRQFKRKIQNNSVKDLCQEEFPSPFGRGMSRVERDGVRGIFVWILVFGFGILPSYAFRPFGVEDAGVAGRGVSQSETSYDYLKWKDGKIENVFLFVPIYGLTDNLEISGEIPLIIHYNTDGTINKGIGDINLVGKYLLAYEGIKTPSFALKGVLKAETGDALKGLGSGDKDFTIVAALSKSLNKSSLHAQIGYSLIGKKNNSNFRDIFLYGLAFDFALSDPLHFLTEINGNRHPDSTETEDPRNFLVGMYYKASEKLIFDLAAKFGLSKSSPDFNLTSGATITF